MNLKKAAYNDETRVTLGKRDTSTFFAVLANPPASSRRLRKAVADYKKAIVSAAGRSVNLQHDRAGFECGNCSSKQPNE